MDAEGNISPLRPSVGDLDGIPAYGDPVDRLPQIVCLGIEGVEPQAVLLGLDFLVTGLRGYCPLYARLGIGRAP